MTMLKATTSVVCPFNHREKHIRVVVLSYVQSINRQREKGRRNGIREIKETRPPIIIINDYCIRLNSRPSSTTEPSFLAFLLPFSLSLSLSVSPSLKENTHYYVFFLQATTPSKSFLFIYNNYLLLYLSSPMFAYVPVWWWVVGNNDDDDKSKNNKNIHSFLILTFCIFLSSTSFLSLFPWFDHFNCSCPLLLRIIHYHQWIHQHLKVIIFLILILVVYQ